MEGEAVSNVCHVGPDCADYLEPGREVAVMFGQEASQSLPVVRPVLLRLTQPVYEDDGDLGGDLPLLVEDPQWLQNPGQESLARVGAAVVDVEAGEEVWLGLEEVVVAPQLGRLAQLPGQRLEELRHQAGGGVVRLAEVVSYSPGGQRAHQAGGGAGRA